MTMTTTCSTLSAKVRPAHLHEAPTTPSSYVIDFAPVRDVSRTGIEVSRLHEIEQEVRKAAAQRRRSTELYDPVEDWLYSLVPAAAIVGLLIGVLGLLDSKTPGTQTTADTKTLKTIEQSQWSQSKDGKF
jgi:hypothetical protein